MNQTQERDSCVSTRGPIGDYAMNTDSKNPSSSQSDVLPTSRLFDDWIDPIESGVRARVRDWIEALVHSELDTALQRPRYGRSTGGETEPAVAPVRGYRNGSRTRTLTGTFGKTDITVPRARLQGELHQPVVACTLHISHPAPSHSCKGRSPLVDGLRGAYRTRLSRNRS